MTTSTNFAKVSGSLKNFLSILLVICCAGFKPNDDKPWQIYYVDATKGSDSQNGLSPQTAWKSLDKVNAAVFFPGDEILFKTNEQWDGQFGNKAKNQPDDKKGLGADPMFVNRGSGSPNGYVLKKGSPAKDAGVIIKDNGGRDYFGNRLKVKISPDIGFYEFPE